MHLQRPAKRPGASLVIFTVLLSTLVGLVAFAVDIGWICLVQNQLQTAADAGALAGAGELCKSTTSAKQKAKDVGGLNEAGGQGVVSVADADVVLGYWNSSTRTFTANASAANAVQVTTRRTANLFFGKLFGWTQKSLAATAIAVATPRDIAFVIDLSGSMNNDTEIWATTPINGAFAGYPTIGTDLMSNVFSDFGYGTYPGTVQHIGQGYLASNKLNTGAYSALITFLTNNSTYGTTYKISSSDSAATKKKKVYSFLIDKQMATLMPNAKPTLSSSSNLTYWTDYLDYVIDGGSSPPTNQNQYTMEIMANPYSDAWPDLDSSAISGFYNKIGYQTYVQFMMDYGYNRKTTDSKYVPLSRFSSDCPLRLDTDTNSPGYNLSFPPREQPTHAVRLALMAAMQQIKALNAGLSDAAKDHVCVITFDTATGVTVKYALSTTSCDYDAARASVKDLQAVADDQAGTASENGLILARQHLDPATNPSGARPAAIKMVIFLSDGLPNVKQTADNTINTYTTSHTAGEWFPSNGTYGMERNAALMQIDQLNALGWKAHAVGVGLGADRTLMDRIARMAGTAIKDPNNPTGPKVSRFATGNPADYQTLMTQFFQDIVGAPRLTLVK